MTTYQHAIELLHQAVSPIGFVASVSTETNSGDVRTCEAVVTGMAALLSGDAVLIQAFKTSLQTIFSHQHPAGFMPSTVNGSGVSYGGSAGRADNPSWAVLGLCWYTNITGDTKLSETYKEQVAKCFQVMEAWEFNGKHLVYVPQSGDWADEYIGHGYLLFDQLLRLWALQEAAALYKNESWKDKALLIRETIRNNYWDGDGDALYSENLRHLMQQAGQGYWQMGFNPSRVYNYFDQVANALALLLNIGDKDQQQETIGFHEKLLQSVSAMLPCFYPEIVLDNPDMRDLSHNYAYRFRNYPGQFHNGGLWPVWNGFTVAALHASGNEYAALQLYYRLEAACALDNFSFNECIDASSGMAIGVPFCTWSAAGVIIARKALDGKFTF